MGYSHLQQQARLTALPQCSDQKLHPDACFYKKLSYRKETVRLLQCMDQFWPHITERRYFVDIIGLSSTIVM